MVGYGEFLALAKDVVGVTLEMSCMAAILYLCYSAWHGWRGHATIIQGVTNLTINGALFWVSGFGDAVS